MGQIRKQAIFSSIITYIGFVIGLINTYFFVKNGLFTAEQYGLTRLMADLGITFYSFATLGILSYIYRFHPYYKAHLKDQENDQFTWSITVGLAGFALVTIASIFFQPLIVRKFTERSPLLVNYYYWILPYTLGFLIFSVSEAFAWFRQKSILTNFLKETALRLFQFFLILLFLFQFIHFDSFIKLYSLSFIVVAIILIGYLFKKGNIHLHFKVSKVTKRFSGRMIPFMSLIYGSLIINTLAQYIDSIVIASVSPGGLSDAGVYTLASFIANTIQVPQRSIIAATIPVLAVSWRTKNYGEIKRIYSRSSINLLLLSLLIFFIIWLNIDDLFILANINKDFQAGKTVILILGISKIIDAGTGVNSQLIGTSRLWKFDVITSIVLLFLTIPLNYFLVKNIGINGSAYANLISFTIYNALRLFFIQKRFNMQPFTKETVYALLAAFSIYYVSFLLFENMHGWIGMFLRGGFYTILFLIAVRLFHITPDAAQLLELTTNRFKSFRLKSNGRN